MDAAAFIGLRDEVPCEGISLTASAKECRALRLDDADNIATTATWARRVLAVVDAVSLLIPTAFIEGVPALVVPDNLLSAVSKACRYEPLLNTSYNQMLAHYGTAALPARPYKPRDKAKVEVAVQVVERWILARLRQQTFFSLQELNRAIQYLLIALNQRPFKKLPG